MEQLKEEIQPLAEKWSDLKLEHTATYGIRRYTNGSWLISHIDRFSFEDLKIISDNHFLGLPLM